MKKRHDGLSPWQKIAGQVIVSAGFSVYCYFNPQVGSRICIPFFNVEWDLGLFYIPIMTLLTIFIVNSSNLQDGLDGLLGTVTAIGASAWTVICLILMIVPALASVADPDGAQVTGTFMISVAGACVGFLRYNRYPAKTFMGDTGSMLLGGTMAACAMLLRLPILLLFIFFTPIMSSVSVILQRYYFKLTHGKRIFLMSPIHHHFEKKGYSETQIVSMYGKNDGFQSKEGSGCRNGAQRSCSGAAAAGQRSGCDGERQQERGRTGFSAGSAGRTAAYACIRPSGHGAA